VIGNVIKLILYCFTNIVTIGLYYAYFQDCWSLIFVYFVYFA